MALTLKLNNIQKSEMEIGHGIIFDNYSIDTSKARCMSQNHNINGASV